MKTRLELYYSNFRSNIDKYLYFDPEKREASEAYFSSLAKKVLINQKDELSIKEFDACLRENFNENKDKIKDFIEKAEKKLPSKKHEKNETELRKKLDYMRHSYKLASIISTFVVKYNIENTDESKKIKKLNPIKNKKDSYAYNSMCFLNLISIPYSNLFGITKTAETASYSSEKTENKPTAAVKKINPSKKPGKNKETAK